MKIRMEHSQMRRFSKNFSALRKAWPRWLLDFLTSEATEFLRKVKARTPVDTGRLRSAWRIESITWQSHQLVATFVNNANDGWANYASFVEEGHAKPYKSGAGPGSDDWVRGFFMLKYTENEMIRQVPFHLRRDVIKLFRKYKVG